MDPTTNLCVKNLNGSRFTCTYYGRNDTEECTCEHNNNDVCITFRVCYFVSIVINSPTWNQMEEWEKAEYLKIKAQHQRNDYANFAPRRKFLVHANYTSRFFQPVVNEIFKVDLSVVLRKLYCIGWGDRLYGMTTMERLKVWPIIREVAGEKQFCAILLLAVRKLGYWPMHPNKLWFVYKVTFKNKTIKETANCEDVHRNVVVQIRTQTRDDNGEYTEYPDGDLAMLTI